MMSRFAWDDDAQAGRDAGTLVLLATKNEPFGQSLNDYAEMIECPEGILVETSTSHRSKGREWDHVILLDGIATEYLASHPGDPAKMDMMGQVENDAEGQRLLYVAVTRAKQSLAILAPTELHPRLSGSRELARL